MLLIVYSWVALGVPLPTIAIAKRASERFPCENSRCGCAAAKQCWRSCCCHTLAERIAWARRNGVQPPKFALDEARRMGIDAANAGDAQTCIAQARPCCAAKTTCCQSKPEQAKPPVSGNENIVAWRALACHGQSLEWFAAPVVTLSSPLDACDFLPPVAWLRPSAVVLPNVRSDTPDTPPPERV
jgi:hypothetical protein